jgi:mannose-1-phosphate guanylyltransferase
MDYAVIIAGGAGRRLWPLSRKDHPKQVLKLFDGQTILGRCFERLLPIFDKKNIIVLTNINYVDIVHENLPQLPLDNIIAEPVVRDTAGAIGLAAAILTKKDLDASMAVVTADQLIEPANILQLAINDALNFVNKNPEALVTFGIKPTFPSSNFGYIKCINPQKCDNCINEIYTVEAFKEKPDENTALKYLDTGQYFWNSGTFFWKAKTILANLEKFLPEATEPLRKIKSDWNGPNRQKTLNEWFLKLPKISIDFAVMEKAEHIHAIKLNCKWLDLGAFTALADFIKSDKNNNIIVAGSNELLDCKNNIVVTEDNNHLIAAIGLENIIIAHSHNATLVCRTDQAQRLKELLSLIEADSGNKYL